jgi:hypothetical protein
MVSGSRLVNVCVENETSVDKEDTVGTVADVGCRVGRQTLVARSGGNRRATKGWFVRCVALRCVAFGALRVEGVARVGRRRARVVHEESRRALF